MARPSSGRGEFGVRVDGLRELRRDLKVIDRKLPGQLNKRLKARVSTSVMPDARRFATVKRGRIARTLKVGTRGSAVIIRSSHPGASTVHWGGRHPVFGNREVWVRQKPRPFITQALRGKEAQIEADLYAEVDAVMRQAGFH